MKRMAQDAAWRLRDLANKLDSEEAFVQSFTETTRCIGGPLGVLPQVTIRAEGPNGTLEYTITMPVRVAVPDEW